MKNKVILPLVMTLFSAVTLTGCTKYFSSYSAVSMIRNNTSNHGYVSFEKLSGQLVFKMQCNKEEGLLEYSGTLNGDGSLTAYYDNGEKTELFTLNSNESIETDSVSLVKGTVYVIIVTNKTCNKGTLDFKIK